jgi:tetratricopeptide (TPR) repeat protein
MVSDRSRLEPPTGRHRVGVLLALGAGTMALYGTSLRHGLTNWDDPEYVIGNPISSQGWAGIISAFTTSFDGAYYPLTQATYAVIHALGGGAVAIHLVQTLLFAAAVAIAPLALSAFGLRAPMTWAVAALWAVHPFRVESVVWAANLKDALAALFFIVAVAAFARRRRSLAVIAFIACVLSKSTFFPLGGVFVLIEMLQGASFWVSVRRSLPFLVAAGATAVVAGVLHLGGGVLEAGVDPSSLVATALWSPWWYLQRILWPAGPREIYEVQRVALTEGRFLVVMLLWLASGVAVWRGNQRVRGTALAVGTVYLLALLPVGGLVPLPHLLADRYTLIPSLALFAGLGLALAWRIDARAATAVLAVGLLACLPGNLSRQDEWRDSVALWEADSRATPDNWTVHVNLSSAYAEVNRLEDAQLEIEKAFQKNPARLDALSEAFFFAGVRTRVPPDDLERLRTHLTESRFSSGSVNETVEWCLANDTLEPARTLLRNLSDAQLDARGLRMRSALARRDKRLADAVNDARQALSRGDPRARVELTYALTDVGSVAEALRVSSEHTDDAYSAALLSGAHAYALTKSGRDPEGRAEAAEALETLRALSQHQGEMNTSSP